MSDKGKAASGVAKASFPERFTSSAAYWEERYRIGGNSGAGSRGLLAEYKAKFVNDFVSQHSIQTVIEFGFGDGEQLTLAEYPEYVGVDVSLKATEICANKFSNDTTKKFISADQYNGEKAGLSLSLDVVYHLVEDRVFDNYMQDIFSSSDQYVIIYSSNWDEIIAAPHVRHRKFTDWVATKRPDFHLVKHVKNPYQFDPQKPDTTTFSDFHVFKLKN